MKRSKPAKRAKPQVGPCRRSLPPPCLPLANTARLAPPQAGAVAAGPASVGLQPPAHVKRKVNKRVAFLERKQA